jgi:hypothetical protein
MNEGIALKVVNESTQGLAMVGMPYSFNIGLAICGYLEGGLYHA